LEDGKRKATAGEKAHGQERKRAWVERFREWCEIEVDEEEN